MRTHRFLEISSIAVLLGLALVGGLEAAGPRWRFDFEQGVVFSGYNNIAIPGDTGTRFSLSRDFRTAAGYYFRARLTWRFAERHSLSALFAPLKLNASGTAPFPIFFFGADIPAGAPVTGTFKFNSYRLSYRYALVRGEKLDIGLGFTAKIRDAAIALNSGSIGAKKTNVGFVPLLNFKIEYRLSPAVSLLLDADALAAPQGRAEDVLTAVVVRLSPAILLRAGYRFVEGGADNKVVYNFTWIHYASVGLLIDF